MKSDEEWMEDMKKKGTPIRRGSRFSRKQDCVYCTIIWDGDRYFAQIADIVLSVFAYGNTPEEAYEGICEVFYYMTHDYIDIDKSIIIDRSDDEYYWPIPA